MASKHLKEQSEERRKWDEEVYKYQQTAYDRDLSELDRQLQAQEITRDEYYDKAVALQSKYFQENSREWLKADEKNWAFREESYKKELKQLKSYRDQGLISEREYCGGIGRLRDTYLAENSDAWQDATMEMHEANEKMLDDQRKVLEAYQKDLDTRMNALKSFAGLFDEIKSDSEVTGQALLSNLRGQVSAFEGWQSDMEMLAERGVTGPLLEELQELGPKAAQEIQALTQLTDKELEAYRDLYAKKISLATEQAERELPPVTVPLEAGELDLSGIQAQVDAAGIYIGSTGGGEALTEAIAPTTQEMSAANQWLSAIKAFTAGIDAQGKTDTAAAQGWPPGSWSRR